ncbi:MAG: SDR family oxidoreductase [Immundisolibacteraceae bacterium]|nr:SDR family oxidoreductase [Immundisolibacteraceae bacterium]
MPVEDLEKKDHFGFSDEELASLETVYRDGIMDGKTVLVSGGGTGIGKAIAFLFARLGANIMLCGRREQPLLDTIKQLNDLGAEADFMAMSIREPEAVETLIAATWDRFGGLDVLINNAGGQFAKPALDLSPKGWNAVIDTNLNGTWYMTQACAKQWVANDKPGCVINIILDYYRGMPTIAHSSASRAAVDNLSRTLAVEWSQYKIRVNSVAPGAIESNGFNQYPKPFLKGFYNSNPMRELGTVQDIAEGCVYLAAPSGKFITGETLVIDGGGQLWGETWLTDQPEHFKPI